VEIARLGPGGRRLSLALLRPGEAFGFLGLLERQQWPHVATALEACELWRFPAREFRRLCRHHPAFTLEVARSLSGKAILFSAKIESLLFKSVRTRLAESLATLAQRFGKPEDRGWRVEIPLTQQTLADLIGASRQHVSSALSRLAAEGLIRRSRGRRSRYEIPDLDRLLAAEPSPRPTPPGPG
jgi:CRP/FNR family transcriptional regulator